MAPIFLTARRTGRIDAGAMDSGEALGELRACIPLAAQQFDDARLARASWIGGTVQCRGSRTRSNFRRAA
jgi:hypothetical protein